MSNFLFLVNAYTDSANSSLSTSILLVKADISLLMISNYLDFEVISNILACTFLLKC